MKRLGACLFRPVRATLDALSQCHQHLSRILKVTPPQQRDTLTGKAIRRIGGRLIVGNDHLLGGWRGALGMPARAVRRAAFRPVNIGMGAQGCSRTVSYRISRRARPPMLISFSVAGLGANPAAA